MARTDDNHSTSSPALDQSGPIGPWAAAEFMLRAKWCPDCVFYRMLIRVLGSPRAALKRLEEKVFDGSIRSIRRPVSCKDRDPAELQVMNTPDWFVGRRYFPVADGLLEITESDGSVSGPRWSIFLETETALDQLGLAPVSPHKRRPRTSPKREPEKLRGIERDVYNAMKD